MILHNDGDVGAAPASGSFVHDGMVIIPCSANTIGRIAGGMTENLVQRAAASGEELPDDPRDAEYCI